MEDSWLTNPTLAILKSPTPRFDRRDPKVSAFGENPLTC